MRAGQDLSAHEYNQRLDEIEQICNGRYGEVVEVIEASDLAEVRRFEIHVAIPGWGAPPLATLVLVEKHLWRSGIWRRFAYLYDLHLEPRPSGRYAFHWHGDGAHRHCEPNGTDSGIHYEAQFFDDIGWAAETLSNMLGEPISCRGLRSL